MVNSPTQVTRRRFSLNPFHTILLKDRSNRFCGKAERSSFSVGPITLLVAASALSTRARAVDGCTVLLCFAAPNWRAISQCVPPITQVLRDLARGKAFPTCAMAGASNSAVHQWASAPSNCPPQYTRVGDAETSPIYSCDFTGAVSVSIGGAPWARTWWSFGGETVTEFAPGAKTQLGTWNTQFDDDYAAWLLLQQSMQPPPVEPCNACGG